MNRPQLPEWVDRARTLMTHARHLTRGELREDKALRHYSSYSTDVKSDLSTLQELIDSPHAAEVWKATENFWKAAEEFKSIPPPLFVFDLVSVVRDSLDGFAFLAITQKERKRAASKIQRHALQLAKEFSNPVVVNCLIRARDSCRDQGMLGATRFVYPNPESFAALAVIAAEMSRQRKEIGQPNSENAHRLYFIRSVTRELHKRAKTPMRSLVFALTSVYFDVRDISVNDLANLAPVSKRGESAAVGSPDETG